jgi:hypothetical protein
MRTCIILLLFPAIFWECTKSNPEKVIPPVITEVWPNNNPQGWPVMIKGTNLKKVTKITFGGIAGVIDTCLDDVVTTWVPAGITSGIVTLVVENAAGESNIMNFEVLSIAPVGPPVASRIVIGRKGKYLPRLPNGGASNVGWSNQFGFGSDHSIRFDFTGNEEIYNGNNYPFEILDFPGEEKKIRIKIQRDIDVYEIYDGQFIEMDDPNSTAQLILFYNEAKRQIVVVNN